MSAAAGVETAEGYVPLREVTEDPSATLADMYVAVDEIYPDYTRPDVDVENVEVSADVPAYIAVRQEKSGWFTATLTVADKAVVKSELSPSSTAALRALRDAPQLV